MGNLHKESNTNLLVCVCVCAFQAAQRDDSTKTANAIVLVTIEDVDDNAPAFDYSNYTHFIPENSPQDSLILQVKVTDKDKVCVAFKDTLHKIR